MSTNKVEGILAVESSYLATMKIIVLEKDPQWVLILMDKSLMWKMKLKWSQTSPYKYLLIAFYLISNTYFIVEKLDRQHLNQVFTGHITNDRKTW